jgi:flagellar hook-associated protein 3 FlgL
MKRISSYMPIDNMQYYSRLREWEMLKAQDKTSTQRRILKLRDDPLGAARSIRFQSKLYRLETYNKNIDLVRDQLTFIYEKLYSAIDIMQRIREIAVQGANGIYTEEDPALGEEVDQLLKELISIANSKSKDDNKLSLFAGFMTYQDAFRTFQGPVPGADGERIVSVEYIGNIGVNMVEISENDVAPYNLAGNYVFWAENQRIFSNIEATEYRVQQDSVIRIDGVDIELRTGDNIYAIISKINDSAAPVKAYLDPVKNSLILESTSPHQIWPQDIGEGTVLQDLGIIQEGDLNPPANISDSANVFGGSIFDMVIYLRDRLFEGNNEDVGGEGLRGIDDALESLINHRSEIDALVSRLDYTGERIEKEIPALTNFNSKEVDVDILEVVTELEKLKTVHQAALMTFSRIIKPTLLDFLR